MVKILMVGATGAMGLKIIDICKNSTDVKIVCGVGIGGEDMEIPVYRNIKDVKEHIDVIIDFSSPIVTDSVIDYAVNNNIGLVMCTTGLTTRHIQNLNEASKKIPVLYSTNMSTGVNLVNEILPRLTEVLAEYDVEIVEKHHNKKQDSPSGTALTMMETIQGAREELQPVFGRHGDMTKRKPNEIGVHAVRGGTHSGEHTVIFSGDDEVIEIKHIAYSKKLFATGAVRGAKYICKKPAGMYTMQDVLK